MRLRWGVLGTGRIVNRAVEHLRADGAGGPGNGPLVIASTSASRARERARELGIPHACSYDELPERSDVDAVYVAALNHLHAPWTRRLLDAGKHVLCEKPLCASRAEAEMLFDAARRNGVVLAEAFTWPHHPIADRLAEIARGPGSPIGRLRRIESWFDADLVGASPRTNRLSHAMHGGALMDVGCYPLGLVRTLAGEEPGDFQTAGEMGEPLEEETAGVDVASEIRGVFPSGVSFSARSAMNRPFAQGVLLTGEAGSARVEGIFAAGQGEIVIALRDGHGRAVGEEKIANPRPRMSPQFERLEAAVLGEAEPLPSPAWSIAQAGVIERGLEQLGIAFPSPASR